MHADVELTHRHRGAPQPLEVLRQVPGEPDTSRLDADQHDSGVSFGARFDGAGNLAHSQVDGLGIYDDTVLRRAGRYSGKERR